MNASEMSSKSVWKFLGGYGLCNFPHIGISPLYLLYGSTFRVDKRKRLGFCHLYGIIGIAPLTFLLSLPFRGRQRRRGRVTADNVFESRGRIQKQMHSTKSTNMGLFVLFDPEPLNTCTFSTDWQLDTQRKIFWKFQLNPSSRWREELWSHCGGGHMYIQTDRWCL